MMGPVVLVDMAKSPDEVKKEVAQFSVGAPMPADAKPSVPEYPYGLSLCLNDDTLDKLGMSGDMPEVGDQIYFCAYAKVTSTSSNEQKQADGTKQVKQRIELQICQMGVSPPDPADVQEEQTEARRQRFYGGKNDAA